MNSFKILGSLRFYALKYKKVSMIVLDSHLQNTIREVDIKKGSKARKILMDAMKHKNCIIAFILIELGCIKNGI